MTTLGWIHTYAAVAALALGAAIVLRTKGTRAHRWLGRAYSAFMAIVIGTAFMIHRLFAGFGPFHWAALVSLVTLTAGLIPVLTRRPRRSWKEYHMQFMCYSYIGLVAAAASEAITRLPVLRLLRRITGVQSSQLFGAAVLGATLLIFAIGSVLVTRARRRLLPPVSNRL